MNNIKIIQTDKFKKIHVSVRFKTKLKKDTVLTKIILANILHDSCDKYPNKKSVNEVLDSMYGATYSSGSAALGCAQVHVCKASIIDPSYLKKDENLILKMFSLLKEFIFHPLKDENGFSQTVFEEAKRNLIDSIQRGEEDPSTFCMYEAMRLSGEDVPISISAFGTKEDVEKITMHDVLDVYHEMLYASQVTIFVVGNVNENEIKKYVSDTLSFDNKCHSFSINYCLPSLDKVNKKVIKKDITQSYITYILTTNVLNDSDSFYALQIGNAILGQLPNSLLFQKVREEHSLCYSIYSALYPYDGALGISTGIEPGNEDKTIELINKQIVCMQNGEFKNELLEMSKRMLVNSLIATGDKVDTILGFHYRNILFNKNNSIQNLIDGLNKVSKEDVIRVMKQLQVNSICVLEGVSYE